MDLVPTASSPPSFVEEFQDAAAGAARRHSIMSDSDSDNNSDYDNEEADREESSSSILRLLEKAEQSHQLSRASVRRASVSVDTSNTSNASLIVGGGGGGGGGGDGGGSGDGDGDGDTANSDDLDLGASIPDLANMLSPSFSAFDFNELFKDSTNSLDTTPRSKKSSVDDSMSDELDSLELVEASIRKDLEIATNKMLNLVEEDLDDHDSSLNVSDIDLSSTSIEVESDVNEHSADIEKADELLQGTQDLKAMLEKLCNRAVVSDEGGVYLSPEPAPPPKPLNDLSRSVSDGNHLTVKITTNEDDSSHEFNNEFVSPMSSASLVDVFGGLNDDEGINERVSSRCVCVKLRPDVLSGVIMDTIHSSFEKTSCTIITKRQGGHIEAIIHEGDLQFALDVQLCVKRHNLARCLLLRAFALEEAVEVDQEVDVVEKNEEENRERRKSSIEDPMENIDPAAVGMKKEKSKLQSIANKFATPIKRRLSTMNVSYSSVKSSVAAAAAWNVFGEALQMLKDKKLLFASLGVSQFGVFPAQSTIDGHFLMQLKDLSRQQMKAAVYKAAADLEEVARRSELSCAALIDMLTDCFSFYDLEEIKLPTPLPLSSYPLDYMHNDEESEYGPFGKVVHDALNIVSQKILHNIQDSQDAKKSLKKKIASTSSIYRKRNSSDSDILNNNFGLSDECVKLVFDAFHEVADREYVCRVGRKNVQVMDRLAKMSVHKESLILALSSCKTENAIKLSEEISGNRFEVPIFWCRCILGMSGVGCRVFVSREHITFVTSNLLNVFRGGGSVEKLPISCLDDVAISSPNRITLSYWANSDVEGEGNNSISFTPTNNADLFASLIEDVQTVNKGDTLRFTERGGLLYNEGDSIQMNMVEEDEDSTGYVDVVNV